jgi:superfamily II DNA or RNA helicase
LTEAHIEPTSPEGRLSARSDSWPFVPRVRLYAEKLLVDHGEGLATDYREETVPVLALHFDYPDGVCRPRRDEDSFEDELGDPDEPESESVVRDPVAESHVHRLIEAFGAAEVDCLEDHVTLLGSDADYVVQARGNVHSFCSFTAYAVAQLEGIGFRVEIDPAYPYQVVDATTTWYADVQDHVEDDWFSFELGIEIDGQRVNLLPALIDLLEAAPDETTLRALERIPARFRAVRVGENRYLPVKKERFLALLRILIDLYDGDPTARAPAHFAQARELCLVGLEDMFEDGPRLSLGFDAERLRKTRALLGGPPGTTVRVATSLRATLRPYQEEGLAWLQHLRRHEVGGVLADDMGLGKTLQTIAHLALEKESGRMTTPTLIVMPTSLVGNWEREIIKFAPHLRTLVLHGAGRHKAFARVDRYDIVLTTYPVLIRDVERLSETQFHLIVLDEAQAIKNPRSRANKAVKALRSHHRLCLSGTPVENNLEELWALYDFLIPGLLGDVESFRARFRVPIEREGDELRLEILKSRVAPFVLRRTKEQVAGDLPPKTELVHPVELEGGQRELYENIRVAAHAEVRGLIRKKGIAASTIAILDALMKLRQVCCDPRLVAFSRAREVEESAKFDQLMAMIDQALTRDRRVLVFSQFAKMLALISEELLRRGIGHATLTGATKHRQRAVDAFQQGKVDVFLISLKAGGTGLNLTRADTVIHYDPWWNPAAQAQATDRAYRIGQTRPVFVHNLIVAGSVEERMLRLQERKRHLADAILGAPAQGLSSFSEEDLDDLFAPLVSESQ